MTKSTKLVIGIVAAVGVLIAGGAIAIAAWLPTSSTVTPDAGPPVSGGEDPTPVTQPPVTQPPLTQPPVTDEGPLEPAPLEDGKWFGFVIAEDNGGPTVLTIDIAEMLDGEAARKAAVDAGVIEEGEDLPNDFFIVNPESVIVTMELGDDAIIHVISGETPETTLTIDRVQLEALFNGSYAGPAVYGIAADAPAAMNVTVEGGEIVLVEAVYLP